MIRRIVLALLAVLLCFSSSLYSYASEVEATPSEQSIDLPDVVEEVNVLFIPEYNITLGLWDALSQPVELESVDWEDVATPNSPPEKKVTARFSHKLSVDNKRGTLNVTVQGYFSRNDSWSEVTSVQARVNGAVSPYFSASTSTSGNEGYVDLYSNNNFIAHYIYRINTSGKIRLVGTY